MVDEREDSYEAHEEGEYHFSDDQVNYDLEPESAKAAPTAKVSKGNPLAKLGSSRRLVIGVIAFLFLIFIVYKMLTSSSTTPDTEFTPSTSTTIKTTTHTVSQKPVKATVVETTQAPTTPVVQETQPQAPMTPPPQPVMNNEMTGPPASTQMTMQPPSQIIQQNPPTQMPPPQAAASAPRSQPPLPQDSVMQQVPAGEPVIVTNAPPPEFDAAQTKMILDRLSALEEQNAKLLSLLQNQVAQKMSDTQMQNVTTQQKVHTLAKRMSNMEGSINKIAQIMQDEGFSKSVPLTVGNSGMPSTKNSVSKTIYTVQAIIPGRAWLKSDAGDTVTVAEGDLLKDYGRIAKIDPYDGVVDIDTGTKTISLSYGIGGD